MTIPQLLIGFHYTKHECKQIIGDVCSSLKKVSFAFYIFKIQNTLASHLLFITF